MKLHDVIVCQVKDYDAELVHGAVEKILLSEQAVVDWLTDATVLHRIVIKPNWIQAAHESKTDVWDPVMTHPSIILAVVRVLARLMAGRGSICICDAPVTSADFTAILQRGNIVSVLNEIKTEYRNIEFCVLDLRREVWVVQDDVVVERRSNPHDPKGYIRYNLDSESMFFGHRGEGRYYGADYDAKEVNSHHSGDVHEYLIAGTPIECDLFINLPKMKTHKKTGITCSLKNFVGINGDKNWLPHHTTGTVDQGGDEFPPARATGRIESILKRLGHKAALAFPYLGPRVYRHLRRLGVNIFGESKHVIRNGNWEGNDTCWRMVLDLNRCLLYGDMDGKIQNNRKMYVSIVDGIVAGEGNGPLEPDPVFSGVILGGNDPAAVDAVSCRLMGFKPEMIPMVREAFSPHRFPVALVPMKDISVFDERLGRCVPITEIAPAVQAGFRPHFGWPSLGNSMQ